MARWGSPYWLLYFAIVLCVSLNVEAYHWDPTWGTPNKLAPGEDCAMVLSSQQVSYHNEWIHFDNVMLKDGKIEFRLPDSWPLLQRTPILRGRRLLDFVGNTPDGYVDPNDYTRWFMNITYVPGTTPCTCDEVIETPTIVTALKFWPQFGHILYDGMTSIYSVIRETNATMGQPIVYIHSHPELITKPDGQLDLKSFNDFVSMMASQVLDLDLLFQRSKGKTLCFRELTVGVPSSLTHDYFVRHNSISADLFDAKMMHDFAADVREHYFHPFQFKDQCDFHAVVLDRKVSHRILNADALADALRSELKAANVPNFCVDVVAMEGLTIAEQISIFSRARMVIGLDGTALLHAAFQPFNCSACVYLTPYMQSTIEGFDRWLEYELMCKAIGGHWYKWDNTDVKSIRFPDDARQSPKHNVKNQAKFDLVLKGSKEEIQAARSKDWDVLWAARLQDMYVNIDEIRPILKQAIQDVLTSECVPDSPTIKAQPAPASRKHTRKN